MAAPSIRVLVVHAVPLVIAGLRHVLAPLADLEVIADAPSGREALAVAERHQPDVIVLDFRLPDYLAPDLCRSLCATAPDARILILSPTDDYAPLRACVDAGASGILLEDVSSLGLVDALRRVHLGHTVLDARARGALAARALGVAGAADPILTPREYEVLRLLARGMTTREIAGTLYLAINTVRSYAQSILRKLNANNRLQALAAARQLNLI